MQLHWRKICFTAVVLMAGIILVTKPPFLFPDNNSNGGRNQSTNINVSMTWETEQLRNNFLSYLQMSKFGWVWIKMVFAVHCFYHYNSWRKSHTFISFLQLLFQRHMIQQTIILLVPWLPWAVPYFQLQITLSFHWYVRKNIVRICKVLKEHCCRICPLIEFFMSL